MEYKVAEIAILKPFKTFEPLTLNLEPATIMSADIGKPASVKERVNERG
jgi:hypothetical protein